MLVKMAMTRHFNLPWWGWLALALPAFAVERAGGATLGPMAQLLGLGLLGAAGSSAVRRLAERRLYDRSPDLTAIRSLDWQQFEVFIGEAFRRQGYGVVRQGGARPDGGVDLELHRGGAVWLVQCKHWKAWDVNVKVVRELYGVVAAENAAGGVVVTAGHFTQAARRFAERLPLRLIDGVELARMRRADAEHHEPV